MVSLLKVAIFPIIVKSQKNNKLRKLEACAARKVLGAELGLELFRHRFDDLIFRTIDFAILKRSFR